MNSAAQGMPASSSTGTALRVLWLFLFGAIACFLAYAVARRLLYPYPLEWLEPGTADIAGRIVDGLPVYAAPTLSYVPPMKTPLFYYLVAGASQIVGKGLVAGRLVSILATLGSLLVIWRFARGEGASRLWALFGIAFYLAAFKISDRWYDLGRLDASLVFFAIAGAYGLRFWRGSLGAAGAGLLLAAAFFTKQTVLMIVAPLWIGLAIAAPGRSAIAALSFVVAVGSGMALLHVLTGGWSSFFLFEVPSHGRFDWNPGKTATLLLLVAPALLASCALIGREQREQPATGLFHGGLLLGALVCSIAGRLHDLAANNSFMPLYAVLAVLAPLGLQQLELTRIGRARPWSADAIALGQVVLLVLTLARDPWQTVPSPADRAAGEGLLAFLGGIDGDVLVMDDRFFARLAGKSVNGLDTAATDLFLDRAGPVSVAFRASIVEALRSGRFVGVIDPPDFVLAAVPLEAPVAISYPPLPPHADPFRPEPRRYYKIAK